MTVAQQAYQPVVMPNGQAYGQPAPVVPLTRSGLSFLIFSWAKAGKSALGDTVPGPRLVLDVEGGSRWTFSRKKEWDPLRQPLPALDGTWDTAIVYVRDLATVTRVYDILNSGQHPFSSLVFDSITEIQQVIIYDLAGVNAMQRDDWGALLRRVTNLVRSFKDLITHPVHPLWGVCFIAGIHKDSRSGKWRALVQGQSQDYLPYYVDVLGHLTVDPNTGNRWLRIGPLPDFETGERVGGRLPFDMQISNPYTGQPGWDLSSMIQQVIAQ